MKIDPTGFVEKVFSNAHFGLPSDVCGGGHVRRTPGGKAESHEVMS